MNTNYGALYMRPNSRENTFRIMFMSHKIICMQPKIPKTEKRYQIAKKNSQILFVTKVDCRWNLNDSKRTVRLFL